MFIVLLIYFAIIFWQFKYSKSGQHDYMGKEQSIAIKGIFAVMIMFSHMSSYLRENVQSIIDLPFWYFFNLFGQLMVVMFLFYSGYGICEAYRSRGNEYTLDFGKKRIVKTLLHFDIAVVFYLILSLILNNTYPTENYFCCWIGWKDIGNSKWFVFDLLVLYTITYFIMKGLNQCKNLQKDEKLRTRNFVVLCLCGTGLFILIMYFLKREEGDYWYNTLLSYPFGMLFSYQKDTYDKMVKKSWGGVFVASLISFVMLYFNKNFIAYNISSCLFAMLVVLINTKIRLINPVLIWLGKKSFSIYIIQRLPMLILVKLGLAQYSYAFVAVTVPMVLVCAMGFDYLLKRVDKRLF